MSDSGLRPKYLETRPYLPSCRLDSVCPFLDNIPMAGTVDNALFMKQPGTEAPSMVQQWLATAGRELAGALALLREGQPLSGLAAFHAQQAAEKYLKALLLHHGADLPTPHSIANLLDALARQDAARAAELNAARQLTAYGVAILYPSDLPEPTLAEARQAVELAQTVERSVLAALGRS